MAENDGKMIGRGSVCFCSQNVTAQVPPAGRGTYLSQNGFAIAIVTAITAAEAAAVLVALAMALLIIVAPPTLFLKNFAVVTK